MSKEEHALLDRSFKQRIQREKVCVCERERECVCVRLCVCDCVCVHIHVYNLVSLAGTIS